jgi:hypothetical protein
MLLVPLANTEQIYVCVVLNLLKISKALIFIMRFLFQERRSH